MKHWKRIQYTASFAICLTLGIFCAQFPFREVYRLEGTANSAYARDLSSCEYEILERNFLGIPVRRIAYAKPIEQVSPGGTLIGLALQSKGLRILGTQFVETKDGEVNTLEGSDVRLKDMLIALDGREIGSIEDVERILSGYGGARINATLWRDGREIQTSIGVAVNAYSGKPSLGLWVKDHISGIGTLSFLAGDNFAALGHAVKDETNEIFPTRTGALYPCELLGVQQGERGVPGHIKGTFSYSAIKLGEIQKNGDFGLYGKCSESASFGITSREIPCCPRQEIKLGKAQLLSAVSGTLRAYDIEILKATNQKKPRTKSMVIRVTDPELIALTGGIVQGMSGSPIMQDGRFAGAVTHVFNSDATKGFALYGDWMVRQMYSDNT